MSRIIVRSPALVSPSSVIAGAGGPFFTTDFSGSQNPLGSPWQNHSAYLSPMKKVSGVGCGTQTGVDGYNDSYAYIPGFGVSYEVITVIHLATVLADFQEVEHVLAWSDGHTPYASDFGTRDTYGYEINGAWNGDYIELGRYNGTAVVQSLRTQLLDRKTSFATVTNGDVFRSRLDMGTWPRIRSWWNGVLIFDYTDNDPLALFTGDPGIGAFKWGAAGSNTDYGFSQATIQAY